VPVDNGDEPLPHAGDRRPLHADEGRAGVDLTGPNSCTGGMIINAGDVVYSQNGSANVITQQDEVQQLCYSPVPTARRASLRARSPASRCPAQRSPRPRSVNANINTWANNIRVAINNALGNAAQPASATVTPVGTLSSNPIRFDINFNGGGVAGSGQAAVNHPKVALNLTNALIGSVGGDITTSVNGSGRQVQTLTLGGPAGGLTSFEFNGLRPNYWNEEQQVTAPGNFPFGSPFYLNVFSRRLTITYSNVAADLAINVQSALNQAFGANVFLVTAVSGTVFRIGPGLAITDPGFPNGPGRLLDMTNIPNITASFPIPEVQRSRFPPPSPAEPSTDAPGRRDITFDAH
jgi:hypothetical protein